MQAIGVLLLFTVTVMLMSIGVSDIIVCDINAATQSLALGSICGYTWFRIFLDFSQEDTFTND